MENCFIRSKTKVIISILLVLTVIIGCMMPVSAASSQLKDTDVLAFSTGANSFDDADDVIYPTIVLPGLSFSDYYLVDDEGNRVLNSSGEEMHSGSFIIDSGELTTKAKGMIVPLIKSIFTQNDSGLSSALSNVVNCATQYIMNKPDGSFVHHLALETFDHPVSQMTPEEKAYYYKNIPLKEYAKIVGEDKVYIYTYNPFGNVLERAEGLADYIDMVKDQTGYDKVNLFTMSMGTTILNQYLNLENADYNSFNRIVNIVPIFDGNEVITELLAKDFTEDEQYYANDFFPIITDGVLGNKTLGYVLNIALRLLSRQTRANMIDSAYSALANAFKYSSQAWTMVQSSRYQELADMFLSSEETKPLRAVTDTYFNAQKNVEKNLLKLQNDYGVGIYNICGYGTNSRKSISSLFSIARSDADTNADCLVPINSSSIGVTYVSRNDKLSDDYLNSLETTAYVSPDKTIDASTCPFRDTTWYYYQQVHWMGGNDAGVNLAALIMLGIVDDIHSDSVNYPQFNWNRDTLDVTNGEYMYMARDILSHFEDYDATLIANLQKAFDKMVEIYKTTNLYIFKDEDLNAAEVAKKAEKDFINALAAFGICDKYEESSSNSLLESVLSKVSYSLSQKYGRNGYFD